MEKRRMGILYIEKKKNGFVPPVYLERVSFRRHFGPEGIWKKFYTKFEFQRGPAYGISKTSYREIEIFYSRYRVFSRMLASFLLIETDQNFEYEYQVRVLR